MILGIDVGQKNLGVCVWDAAERQIRQWAVWESAGTWAREVHECLARNATDEFLEGVTKVVIEHQPSKNPSMTRIMHYLEYFFVSKGLPVSMQDSKHKLLFASTTDWFPKDCTDREWTYRHRKKLAVDTIGAFLRSTRPPGDPHLSFFESSKKKDDLADALLHAMAHASFGVLGPSTRPIPQKKKIVARAPTQKQLRTGRLSASNVKHYLKDVDPGDISDSLRDNPQLKRALKKHFGTVETYLEQTKKNPST